ncbi:MAG: hypothetical protein ACTSUG_02200, partial [Candidatus Helarchaeota archaeon]
MNGKIINPIDSIYTHLGLKNWIYHNIAILRLRENKKKAEQTNLLKNLKIVINAVRPIELNFNSEVFFGLIFALNGAIVKILFDDGVLEHWDVYQFDTLPINQEIDKISLNPFYNHVYLNKFNKRFLFSLYDLQLRKHYLKAYSHDNLEFIFYSQFIDKKEINYKNIDELNDFAFSSTIRFFKT